MCVCMRVCVVYVCVCGPVRRHPVRTSGGAGVRGGGAGVCVYVCAGARERRTAAAMTTDGGGVRGGSARRRRRRAAAGTATMTTVRATGGDDGIERRARRRLETKWGDETEIFVSAIYIGWAFSTGSWLQPVLKAYFRQAKRRETKAFSIGWSHQPVLKGGL